MTITIDAVDDSQSLHPSSRSKVTIEDLATKIGTVVNGKKVKGTKYVVENEAEIQIAMGKCPNKFRYATGAVSDAGFLLTANFVQADVVPRHIHIFIHESRTADTAPSLSTPEIRATRHKALGRL